MKKSKFLVLLTVIVALLFALCLNVSAQEVKNGWYLTSDGWTYYCDDSMYTDNLYYLDNGSGVMNFYRFDENGIMLSSTWYEDGECLTYFKADGAMASSEILLIDGSYYAFDTGGSLFVDCYFDFFDAENNKYYSYLATATGALYCDGWYYDTNSLIWYYFGKNGAAASGYTYVNGTPYFFNSDGSMATDTVIYDEGYIYVVDLTGYAKWLPNNTWSFFNGNYYYVLDNTLCENDIYLINGTYYAFEYGGRMISNGIFSKYNSSSEDFDYYYAKPNGALYQNSWMMDDGGCYYYYGADCKMVKGFHTINGALYCFDDYGQMFTYGYLTDGDNNLYIVSSTGALVHIPNEVWTLCDGKWYYAKNDTLYQDGVYQIDGKFYGFDYQGAMQTNTSFDTYSSLDGYAKYRAKKDGSLYRNEWFCDYYGDWYYFGDDCKGVSGLQNIAGSYHYFYDGGCMAYDDYVYLLDSLYLIDKNGNFVTQKGWHILYGEYVYVCENGTLCLGWHKIDNLWYYFYPFCSYGTIITDDDNTAYLIDSDGSYKQLTQDGFYYYPNHTIYIRDGKPVLNDWIYENGQYYFINYFIGLYSDGYYEIDNEYYYFDINGRLRTGWILSGDTYYYANSDGVLLFGLQNIGGVNYYFNHENGVMYADGVYDTEFGVITVDKSGAITSITTDTKWILYENDWYYALDGSLIRYQPYNINNCWYVFGESGRMLKNQIADSFCLDENGTPRTGGWILFNGEWLYADNEGFLSDGLVTIDNVRYYFNNCIMVANKTFMLFDTHIASCDANGVCTITTIPNGWTHINGQYIYKENGAPYTGWLGNYYIEDGYMLYSMAIEYDNKYYCLKKDGSCLYNGWYYLTEPYGESYYVYAKADGSLCNNEWLFNGGKWYYFSSHYMLEDDIYLIDNKYYIFDETGAYVGESPAIKDGWHLINGKWYFYNAGYKHFGWLYDNGAWYFLSDKQGMICNDFVETYRGSYYMNSDGTLFAGVGWNIINGEWLYFNNNNIICWGWINDASGTYYSSYIDGKPKLVTGYYQVDNILYQFASDGRLIGKVNRDGWYKSIENWHYIKDGHLIESGLYNINGVNYYFENGHLASEEFVPYKDSLYYTDKNGNLITKSGWLLVDGEWIYILKDGSVAFNGIYFINGVQYTFVNGFMI